jgi:hypothetical protein
MILLRGCRCQVDTTGHFCPHPNYSYRGWGAGAISALTAIPIAAAGDRAFVSVAEALSWRRITRRFAANRSSPTTGGGAWEPAPKASASAVLHHAGCHSFSSSMPRSSNPLGVDALWGPNTASCSARARAAGLTDRMWSLRDVPVLRVPP